MGRFAVQLTGDAYACGVGVIRCGDMIVGVDKVDDDDESPSIRDCGDVLVSLSIPLL